MLYVLILHFASGGLYDSAAVIGPLPAATCEHLVASNPTIENYVTCVTWPEVNRALVSYGCKMRQLTPHETFTDTNYICE
jgi:hypothetical protein